MATRSPRLRLEHIRDAIAAIDRLTRGASLAELRNDEVRLAALERFLEIVSEASRHVPDEAKRRFPDIPWRAVAALGNRLRHEYQAIRPDMLWHIATHDLDALAGAVDALLAELRDESADDR